MDRQTDTTQQTSHIPHHLHQTSPSTSNPHCFFKRIATPHAAEVAMVEGGTRDFEDLAPSSERTVQWHAHRWGLQITGVRQGPSSAVQSDGDGTPARRAIRVQGRRGGLHILAYAMIAWAELTPDFSYCSPTIFWAARTARKGGRRVGSAAVAIVLVFAHIMVVHRSRWDGRFGSLLSVVFVSSGPCCSCCVPVSTSPHLLHPPPTRSR